MSLTIITLIIAIAALAVSAVDYLKSSTMTVNGNIKADGWITSGGENKEEKK